MIRKQFKEQYSRFLDCCSPGFRELNEEKRSQPRLNRGNKISLKGMSDRTCNRVVSTSPTIRHGYTFSQNCPTIAETVTSPRPKIVFSWKNQMVQTTRKQGLVANQLQQKQLQLRETRTNKFHQNHLIQSKFDGQMISQASGSFNSEKARFEESLILVDYFNPTTQQMSKIQNYFGGQS